MDRVDCAVSPVVWRYCRCCTVAYDSIFCTPSAERINGWGSTYSHPLIPSLRRNEASYMTDLTRSSHASANTEQQLSPIRDIDGVGNGNTASGQNCFRAPEMSHFMRRLQLRFGHSISIQRPYSFPTGCTEKIGVNDLRAVSQQ